VGHGLMVWGGRVARQSFSSSKLEFEFTHLRSMVNTSPSFLYAGIAHENLLLLPILLVERSF